VEGGSLSRWIRTRKLYEGGHHAALLRILDFAIQFSWGLHYAHEKGLVHQDIKPPNVLINEQETVKVSDFGLSKARAVAGEKPDPYHSAFVSSGGITPAYCSPEQSQGLPLSRRTDIWSWGISILEMFCGEPPCRYGLEAADVLSRYSHSKISDPSIPRMPEEIAELLGIGISIVAPLERATCWGDRSVRARRPAVRPRRVRAGDGSVPRRGSGGRGRNPAPPCGARCCRAAQPSPCRRRAAAGTANVRGTC
jgi:serine/threonine protein kinase